MTKAEFIQTVHEQIGEKSITKTVIETVLNNSGAVVIRALRAGENVGFALCGLGSLKVVKRAAREGRNPRTGAPVQIPAKDAVKFKAGKTLKDALKG